MEPHVEAAIRRRAIEPRARLPAFEVELHVADVSHGLLTGVACKVAHAVTPSTATDERVMSATADFTQTFTLPGTSRELLQNSNVGRVSLLLPRTVSNLQRARARDAAVDGDRVGLRRRADFLAADPMTAHADKIGECSGSDAGWATLVDASKVGCIGPCQ